MSLQSVIEAAISATTHQEARIAKSQASRGSGINDSRIVTLEDGRHFFVKTNPESKTCPGLFETEYEALLLLSEPGVIHVPKPISYGDDFIVVEVFNEGAPANDWQERMGRSLAELHIATKTDRFGFYKDNYLGLSKQINSWKEDWLSFWRDQRLGLQLKRLAMITEKNDPLLIKGEQLMSRLESLLADINEPAVLLHGDLWSGNVMFDQGGPWLIDPAIYYGDREVDLAMTKMFGGFAPEFYQAYLEAFPLPNGSELREVIYNLYHYLNHYNLFGSSYLSNVYQGFETIKGL